MIAAPLLLALALPAPAHASEPLRVRGLAVGVDAYASPSVPPLRYAVSDAVRFRSALVDNGGGAFQDQDLELIADERATLAAIRPRLQELLGQARPDDVIVLFFSTHGSVVEGRGYLYMHDTELATLERSGLAVAELQRWIEESPARHVLLFTDACHAAAVGTLRAGEGFPADNPFNAVLSSMERSEGSLFNLASSLVQQQSYEGWMYCGGGGAFTCALTEALSGAGDLDGDGLVRLAELSTFVQGRVMELTRYAQTPEAKGDYAPGLVIATPGRGAPPAAPAAALDDAPLVEVLLGAGGDAPSPGADDATEPAVASLLGALSTTAPESSLLSALPVEDQGYGGLFGEAEAAPAASDEPSWRAPWRPWVGMSALGGVVAGQVVPVARADLGGSPSTTWAGGAAPLAGLRLSLHEGALFHPHLLLAVSWVDAKLRPEGGADEERSVPRLGWEVQEQVRLRPWAALDPYLLASGGAWGGRWVQDGGGLHFRNTLWGPPWLVGGGAGLEWYPTWSGGWTVQLEVAGHALLGLDGPAAVGRSTLALTAAL